MGGGRGGIRTSFLYCYDTPLYDRKKKWLMWKGSFFKADLSHIPYSHMIRTLHIIHGILICEVQNMGCLFRTCNNNCRNRSGGNCGNNSGNSCGDPCENACGNNSGNSCRCNESEAVDSCEQVKREAYWAGFRDGCRSAQGRCDRNCNNNNDCC